MQGYGSVTFMDSVAPLPIVHGRRNGYCATAAAATVSGSDAVIYRVPGWPAARVHPGLVTSGFRTRVAP